MPAKKRSRSNSKQVYIICAIVTLAVLGVIFGIHEYKDSADRAGVSDPR